MLISVSESRVSNRNPSSFKFREATGSVISKLTWMFAASYPQLSLIARLNGLNYGTAASPRVYSYGSLKPTS